MTQETKPKVIIDKAYDYSKDELFVNFKAIAKQFHVFCSRRRWDSSQFEFRSSRFFSRIVILVDLDRALLLEGDVTKITVYDPNFQLLAAVIKDVVETWRSCHPTEKL